MKKSVSSHISMVAILASSIIVSGCSWFGGSKSLDVEAGPDNTPYTEDIVDNVPSGLVGDSANSRQTTERLKNNDE